MTHTVTKAFTTRTRRFAIGDAVLATDDVAPHSREDLEKRGFLADPNAKPASGRKAAAKS